MADETAQAPADSAEHGGAKPGKGPNKLILPLVVVLMTVVGGLAGVLVVGPKIVAARAPVSAGLDPEHGGEEEEAKGGEHGGAGERGPMFKIDNLIVNPAGSQGARFLMVSVAVETPDAKLEEELRSREPVIRDVVIALLEKQTMEQLAMPGIRDSIKAMLGDTISAIAGTRSHLKVFLPQFVIQ